MHFLRSFTGGARTTIGGGRVGLGGRRADPPARWIYCGG
jgi:hypothetical protein